MSKASSGTEAKLAKSLLITARAMSTEELTAALCAVILQREDFKERQLRRIASACITAPEINPN